MIIVGTGLDKEKNGYVARDQLLYALLNSIEAKNEIE